MRTSPITMLGGGFVALLLSALFKLRLLPFLQGDTIISGGRAVLTTEFADFGARWLFGFGASFVVASFAWLAVRAMRRKE